VNERGGEWLGLNIGEAFSLAPDIGNMTRWALLSYGWLGPTKDTELIGGNILWVLLHCAKENDEV